MKNDELLKSFEELKTDVVDDNGCIGCRYCEGSKDCHDCEICTNCTNCYKCDSLKNCTNCILCKFSKNKSSGERYYVLNEEVKEEEFNEAKKELGY